jgi:hypothetical protein
VQRLCEERRSRRILEDSKRTKLRRESAFMHRAIAAEVAEAKELFGEFRVLKAQERKRL